jgi:hypothetical protein
MFDPISFSPPTEKIRHNHHRPCDLITSENIPFCSSGIDETSEIPSCHLTDNEAGCG